MKKVVLLLLSAVGMTGFNMVKAQSFTVAHDTVSVDFASAADVHNLITNTTASSLILEWKVLNYDLGTGFNNPGMCDNNLCYTGIATMGGDVKEANPINGMGTMDVKVQYYAATAPLNTTSWVTVQYWDKSNPSDTKTATFIGKKSIPTSVSGVSKSDDAFMIYPNPARESINISFDNNAGVKAVTIYNMIGKAVGSYKMSNSNSAKLDISNLPSGVYFVRLLDAQNRIIGTRKFTHQ